jgi:casein kinase II subunit alpha
MGTHRHSYLQQRKTHVLLTIYTVASLILVRSEKAYPLGCSQQSPSYYDFEHAKFPPPNLSVFTPESFQITRRLGTEKFSDVFEALYVGSKPLVTRHAEIVNTHRDQSPELVVLKVLKPVSPRKIRRELLVLQHASKIPSLVRILGIVIPPEPSSDQVTLPRMPSIVLEHAGPYCQWFCHGKTNSNVANQSEMSPFLSDYEIRYYLYHLLLALDKLHAQGMMHRDVKPRNVLINRAHRKVRHPPLTLIDLGLADFYVPQNAYNVRVASRHYKSPELLVGFESYDYALDIWGVGCILAGLLCRREPFFRGKDNIDQLGRIISALGTNDLLVYLQKYNIPHTESLQDLLAKYQPHHQVRQPWLRWMAEGVQRPSRDGLDLLDKLLVYDHEKRLTARQAMQHPFFDVVKERVQAEVRTHQYEMNASGEAASIQHHP